MLRERSGFLNGFWRLVDLVLLIFCFTVAYYIRFAFFPLLPEAQSIPTLAIYLPNILLLSFLWLIVAESLGLYKSKRIETLWADWKIIARQQAENPVSEVGPDNLVYVIYTSGSTGKPKGTLILHRGVVNYLTWCLQTYPM